MEELKSTRKTRVGKVMSNKMDKTVVVMVERLIRDVKYRKFVRRRNTFKAHDPQNSCAVGDQVLIEESRPISKEKRWLVVKVLDKAAF
ncbi:MAG: 30S ribosomal protein S17 [Syntrophobacteraceae bacterium]|nr:30S ribosomal protein S17 [Syntrophobacteraceae bacterium]